MTDTEPETFTVEAPPRHDPQAQTLILAVAVLVVAVFLMTVFQGSMLIRARQNLNNVHTAQEQPLQDGTKLRQRVEDLAGRTAKLANEGNANAKAIVDNFRRQGVELKEMKPPAP